jgi:hypothetical protein
MRSGRRVFRGLVVGGMFAAATPAMAAPSLLGWGYIDPNLTTDLSGLGGQTLENGLPGNVLGGMGSGLAWAGGNTFLATPDRGPNATNYGVQPSPLDNTASYISRFQTVQMTLTAGGTSINGTTALPFAVTPTLAATTLLSSPTALNYGTGTGLGLTAGGTPVPNGAPALNTTNNTNYFTGRSDNFGAGNSGNPANARLDPEGIRMANDGRSVFISDEYGPYVYQFDRATGARIRSFTLPSSGAGNLDIANLSPVGATEISGNTTGRTTNKGMEGLAITPDGKTLVGIMQAPLLQDAANSNTNKLLRIVTIDIATGTTHEYGYLLTTGTGVSEITAINDHEFLVDERDGKGLGNAPNDSAVNKKLYKIDLTGATDITNLSGLAAKNAAVSKTQFVDLVSLLTANGWTASEIPSKIEGLAFGADVISGGTLYHTLWVANDNDFVPGSPTDTASGNSGPNEFYVLGVTDADLRAVGSTGFAPQGVPEPGTITALVVGLAGLGVARRRRRDR